MDFLNQIKKYIETNIPVFKTPLSVGALLDGDDIAIVAIPGIQPNKNLDLSRNYVFPFQILVRHAKSSISYSTCQTIADHLDTLTNGAVTSGDGSFNFVKCDLYTTPNFVERTADGDIYTAMFQAELYLLRSE
ncbi:hypothetical protein FKN04_22380 [Bacillus glycinifermentans]|uniref:phage tail terminator protein n=1 Tax=Bacillus glycinifermentans TaxID=1664069 RepID=UPI0015832215|nr:minor capsid protein [Bacillus glycinifermentans]NUJ19283.1 hypothetical protein [Bacillus glycinifermentans]